MNLQQQLFLSQARSDFEVFLALDERESLPPCHALHYLQMTTEMLGKSFHWRTGSSTGSHRAFVQFLRSLATNSAAKQAMDYGGRDAAWQSFIRSMIPLAQTIEDLAPALAGDGPNPEYPWPRNMPLVAPIDHAFPIWSTLNDPKGQRFLGLLTSLLDDAESYL